MASGAAALAAFSAPPRRSFFLWRPSRRRWLGFLLLSPAVAVTSLLILYPLAMALNLSFERVRIVRIGAKTPPYTLENYLRLSQSAEFWNALLISMAFVLVVTAGSFAVGLGSALLVNEKFPGRRAARLLVALPWAVPEVVAAAIFTWIFDGSFGVANWLLMQGGILATPFAWLNDPHAAFAVCAAALIWTGYPFVAVMALAGLQAIPAELYEAAQMDGAGAWRRFFAITLPCLRPVLSISLVLVVLRVIRDFATVYVMTAGGPAGATRSLAIETYEQAFSFYNIGYGAAIGMVTLLACAAFSTAIVTWSVGRDRA
jgi:multiple sugar transport system permease protein